MQEDALLRRLKALTAFRAFFVTLLLGSFYYLEIGGGDTEYTYAVLYFIVAMYSLTIVYSMLLHHLPALPMAYAQIGLDAISASVLVMITGGVDSWFSWLLLMVVLSASLIIGRRASYIIATISSLMYGTLIDLQYYGIIPVHFNPDLMEKDFLYRIFSHISGMYLIAYLTGTLVFRIERRDMDIRDLSMFNREVIESTPSGLFTTDLAGRVMLFNRAAERITSRDRGEVIGEDIRGVFPFLRDLDNTRRTEATIETRQGQRVIGLTMSNIKAREGTQDWHIGMFQDLTEIKEMTRLIKMKENLAALGELSAKIAHEIRNPLASLKGSMEMLMEGNISPEHRERLMRIAVSEMDRLNTTITDFLSYARPTPLEKQVFEIQPALDELIEMLKNRNPEGIEFVKAFGARPIIVMADPGKLKDVLWNLGINALDAMPKGGRLTVGAEDSDAYVEIYFEDTGSGIPIEDHDRIFFPFFTTKRHGTGLGLSTAYRAVADHGGTLALESEPGKGARFTVILPKHEH